MHTTAGTLLNIGRWKAPSGRILHYIEENSAREVNNWTTTAFHATSEYATIDSLLELRGVGVPVASSVLAMWDPEEYAVIDFRALRALSKAKPVILNRLQPYDEHIRYFDALREYNSSIEAYQFYLDHIRDIAEDGGGIPARKVEMALWAYDKENSQ